MWADEQEIDEIFINFIALINYSTFLCNLSLKLKRYSWTKVIINNQWTERAGTRTHRKITTVKWMNNICFILYMNDPADTLTGSEHTDTNLILKTAMIIAILHLLCCDMLNGIPQEMLLVHVRRQQIASFFGGIKRAELIRKSQWFANIRTYWALNQGETCI